MENQMIPQRDLSEVEGEIIFLKTQAQKVILSYVIEIGRRLTEAKAIVPRGEWAEWLENKVDFSQRTATNYMKLYEEYGSQQISLFGNSQAIANLDYTKALALLAVPRDERDEFIEENDVENLTTRELEAAIKERDEALQKAEQADRLREEMEIAQARASKAELDAAAGAEKIKTLNEQIASANAALEKAKESEKKAKAKAKELKENPVIPQETMDKLKEEAEQAAASKTADEIEQKTAELKEQLEAAKKAQSAAEENAQKAAAQAAELEKKLKMSSPNVAEFKRLYLSVQEEMQKLRSVLEAIKGEDSELGEKMHTALKALIGQFSEV